MYYLLRYGEIALKGKNRRNFEFKLINNIKKYIKNKYNLESDIRRIRGRLILKVSKEVDLRPIFGLTSYSPSIRISNNIEDIKKLAIKTFEKHKAKTFKIKTSRLNKSYELKSPQINNLIGSLIDKKYETKVDLENPELTLGIEIHNKYAYIYTKNTQCFSGLPIGSSGNIYLKYNRRAILAALELMKRGCKVILTKNPKTDLLKQYNNYEELETSDKVTASPAYFKNIDKSYDFYPIALLSDKEVDKELKNYDIFKT